MEMSAFRKRTQRQQTELSPHYGRTLALSSKTQEMYAPFLECMRKFHEPEKTGTGRRFGVVVSFSSTSEIRDGHRYNVEGRTEIIFNGPLRSLDHSRVLPNDQSNRKGDMPGVECLRNCPVPQTSPGRLPGGGWACAL